MKKIVLIALSFLLSQALMAQGPSNEAFRALLESYHNDRMQVLPLESTYNGGADRNDQLPADFTDAYRAKMKAFFNSYRNKLRNFDPGKLNANDRLMR